MSASQGRIEQRSAVTAEAADALRLRAAAERARADSYARVLEDIAENGLPDPNECKPWEELRDQQYARLGIDAGKDVA